MNGRGMETWPGVQSRTRQGNGSTPPLSQPEVFANMCRRLLIVHADISALDTTLSSFSTPAYGRSSVMLLGGSTPIISEKKRSYVHPEGKDPALYRTGYPPEIGTSLGGLAVYTITTRLHLEEGEIVANRREMRQEATPENESSQGSRSTGSSEYRVLVGEEYQAAITHIFGSVKVMSGLS